jgi:hypothetical protein
MFPPRIASIVAAAVIAAGCALEEPRLEAPALDPQASGARAIEVYDLNNDGAIAADELDRCPGLKASLKELDTSGDQRLSAEEIAARVQQYVDSQVALTTMTGQVRLDNRPLADAQVTLVPEEFMGPGVQKAVGVTDASGSCRFSIEGAELPGAQYGIYRVEVSKPGPSGRETIPARYNKQSVLGGDVGRGSPILQTGFILDLSSS